uniref:Nucleotide-diphospho-sugar transferase domain-containing protein n=1 Tax=Octactis speculum TaxID=3111310 RepID=A0A7S2MNR5_9STRA|mmetsp:Transcript_7445/g.9239  ORF Transcript_7445/g.9239 Transcript_7445/m.9239 type:complete len:575 (+) Transcript_7445:58-1782(+)
MRTHRKKNDRKFGSGWVTTMIFVGAIAVSYSFGHVACHADCAMRETPDSKPLQKPQEDSVNEEKKRADILDQRLKDIQLKLDDASQEIFALNDAKASQATEIERLLEKLRAQESVEVMEADDSLLRKNEQQPQPAGNRADGKISGPVKGTSWASINTFDQTKFHEVLGLPYQHPSRNALLFDKKQGCDELVVVITGKKPKTCLAVLERTFLQPEVMKLELPQGVRWNSAAVNSIPWTQPGTVDLYPRGHHRENSIDKLGILLKHYLEMKEELKPILTQISRFKKKTVIVMCLNQGNLDLVFNFICSCRNLNIDIRNLIVFAADELTHKTLTTFGVQSYWHVGLGDFPAAAARAYGDATFVSLMWLKVVSVFLVNDLGFNQIFQDADLVWFKDPMPYFWNQSAEMDTFWQDDGARSNRFSPLFANSGFYFVRNTEPAKHFVYSLLISFHEIMAVRSHQHVLDKLLLTHKAHYGMGVKVLDKEEFPQGQVFHHNKALMQRFANLEVTPYVFHMCWTANKKDKLKYMKQVGLWYLKSECDIDFLSNADGAESVKSCCDATAKPWRPDGPGKLPNLRS